MLLEGEADLGVATQAIAQYPELAGLPCYRWTHAVIAPPGHALAEEAARATTLARLAVFPIITYEPGWPPAAAQIDEARRRRRPAPRPGALGDGRRRHQDPTWSWGWAWASSPASPSTRRATPACAPSTRATCSRPTSPVGHAPAAACCATTPTTSSAPSPPLDRALVDKALALAAGHEDRSDLPRQSPASAGPRRPPDRGAAVKMRFLPAWPPAAGWPPRLRPVRVRLRRRGTATRPTGSARGRRASTTACATWAATNATLLLPVVNHRWGDGLVRRHRQTA